jgi:hypothetical protein
MKSYKNSILYESRALGAMLTTAALFGFGALGCVPETDQGAGAGTEEETELAEAEEPILYANHDYLFFLTPRSWANARTTCQNLGYYLVTVNDYDEEVFLGSTQSAQGGGGWWLGHNDTVTEGAWTWVNGASSFKNWAAGEPSNSKANEDCAMDNWLEEGTWNDATCTDLKRFICERNSGPPAATGSFTYAASNTNNATQNVYTFQVLMNVGQTIRVGTCDIPGALNGYPPDYYSLSDTFLRLNNSSNVELAQNDDSCGNVRQGSHISAIAPTTGSYTILAGCFDSSMCAGTVAYTIQ